MPAISQTVGMTSTRPTVSADVTPRSAGKGVTMIKGTWRAAW